jgi:DNA invertase Pin-like site-specific DNA recombinase
MSDANQDKTELDAGEGRPARPMRKLFPKEWLEIVGMAKSGVPVEKIAKSFGVQPSTIYKGLKRRNITIGAYTPSAAEVHESAERRELIARIKETKDKDYRFTEFLQRQVVTLIAEQQKEKRPFAAVIDDVKALKLALDAVRSGTDNKWKILGLDKENDDADKELPELPLRELTEDEIAAIRDRQIMEDGGEALEALDGEDEGEIVEESGEPDED